MYWWHIDDNTFPMRLLQPYMLLLTPCLQDPVEGTLSGRRPMHLDTIAASNERGIASSHVLFLF